MDDDLETDETTDEAREGRQVVGPVVLLAVLGSVTAGCIQIALGEAVPEQTGVRGLSLVEGLAQVLVGAGLLVFASRRAAMWTVVVNCFAIATWSLTS
ncbi:MAG TPA: hypothetical protein VMP42_05805, partial [Actinomycetota bacterium]|nr:hypothetical protein [Actinomycetota bacterium]